MSLHTLANHLQTAGRGDDKMLVHMTPREVHGLQSLAMAHGGSLTINPHTGLPEAGFLSGILPMIAGAAMTAFSGGAINPMTAGLITGAAGTAMTGSLGKGLMMGLGAYGGAGLGAGLLGGTEAVAAGTAAGASGIAPAVSAGAMPGVVGGAGALAPAAGGAAAGAAGSGAAGTFGGIQGTNVGAMYGGAAPVTPPTTQLPINAANAGNSFVPTTTGGSVVSTTPQNISGPASSVESATSGWDKLKSMPGKAFDLLTTSGPEGDKQREEFLKQNKGALIASGIGVLGASREDPRMPKQTKYATHEYDWNRQYNPSSMDPGSTAERRYFADGGLAGLPVEQMSQQNATSDNTRFPMAFQNTPSYATPSQRPISQNVVYPATDADTTPYSGTERAMATGGVVALAPGGPAKLTPAEQARANAEKAIANLKLTEFDNAKIAEPKGGFTSSSINSAYKTALDTQQKEITNIQNLLSSYADPKTGKAKKPEYASAIEYLQGILDANKKDIDAGTTAKTTALQDFSKATTRGEGIGTKGISAIPVPTVEPGKEKMVLQPDGTFAPEKPTPQYQKLGYGKITATTGWDNTIKKPYEPDDVSRVFEEVAGRKPTSTELATYVGTTGTLQGLANTVNKSPDIAIPRGKTDPFTDAELQANAKYYWGREMTTGELANYKKANYANFGALRNALTSANSYVDNLNKLNETQFTKQNAPVVTPANNVDISSVFVDTLGRKPTAAEMKSYLDKKVSKADLATQLKTSDEYGARLVQPDYSGNGTSDGITGVYPKDGGTGLVPPVTTVTPGTLTRAQMDALTQQYAAQPAVSKGSPYAPEQAPQYQIAGAMPNRDVNKELGLTGLYQQIAQKSPEIQQGLKFDPNQAQAMASPFSNVNPGMVTLQSAATPQPYAPPTPVVPGQQGYSPALTPEEQQILSALQSQPKNMATGGMTGYNLGGYSDGGRLLKGPGDGVSDSIPATIGDRQPARLADGEFVVPARIVSELGNGSTDAGARKLYAMMQRIQQARGKTVGKNKVAVKSGADKMLPA